jgi:hypothetical protein
VCKRAQAIHPVSTPSAPRPPKRFADSKGKQAKLKSPLQLQELLDTTRGLLEVGCLGGAEETEGRWEGRKDPRGLGYLRLLSCVR